MSNSKNHWLSNLSGRRLGRRILNNSEIFLINETKEEFGNIPFQIKSKYNFTSTQKIEKIGIRTNDDQIIFQQHLVGASFNSGEELLLDFSNTTVHIDDKNYLMQDLFTEG